MSGTSEPHIAVFGASGAIGGAFVREILARHPRVYLHAVTRSGAAHEDNRVHWHRADYRDETSLGDVAAAISRHAPIDLAIVATGRLHDAAIRPEKALRDISAPALEQLYFENAVIPALILKHVGPLLRRDGRAVFAALSARVGSISDNRLGGWYGYRASKAALNMLIKTASIELARRNPEMIVAGLHPGTVDSPLSGPFQSGVKPGKLFTPDFAAHKLLDVLDGLQPEDSGHCFAWDGQRVPA
ncbi:SDR family NAD(P)-dependent oxidoreductase [Hoeflea prorocentri]|uniref:SDR family NAD(P)-dependent oxidoreductase n=1 Tax=Hoeflea prorocentri TaxID=1922333 RepID=A0A9X3UKV0_9HYPH|nr:SDR family NAD(P)-dependent oxidoreductase [Hoeflea prorocentri]MCY6382690.1 SDR family NAD(P)-dependent oxidoreductase [Hoeflea prorocentri]MDA5400490.1 SDR family NAD(P)-dependent oxidoreductase [Hoeflea prorocentri]